MRRLSVWLVAAALVGFFHLTADGQEKKKKEDVKKEEVKVPPKAVTPVAPAPLVCCPPGHSFKHLDGRPLVFVANGAGDSSRVSDNLMDLNDDRNLGLRIKKVEWCRHGQVFHDLIDNQAQLNAAARIACTVTAIRKDCPNLPIFLVGQSAGARIVLAAGEMLPEKSIDRIIVLSPAVSCSYNLTGALRASRGGIYNFYSAEDWVLEYAVEHHTLADGLKGQAAGRVGFRPASADRKDIEAFHRNVHQVRWTEEFNGSGGHQTWTLSHNLKRVVVPLLISNTSPVEPPPFEIRRMPPAK